MSPRRPVYIPLYAVLILVFAAVLGPVLSIAASVKIADRNSAELVRRYEAAQVEANKKAEAEAAKVKAENKLITCALFDSQLDAFDEQRSSLTPTGVAVREAWLDIYRTGGCQPPRK